MTLIHYLNPVIKSTEVTRVQPSVTSKKQGQHVHVFMFSSLLFFLVAVLIYLCLLFDSTGHYMNCL